MRFKPLLGKRLKDDEVIEILEHFDMDVILSSTDCHEGQPDKILGASRRMDSSSDSMRTRFLMLFFFISRE